MRHPEQQTLTSYPPVSAVPPSPVMQETVRLITGIISFNLERGGRIIEATYSTRNSIVTVKCRGKTPSTYSSQGDEANYEAIVRQLLSVMSSI